MANFTKGKTFTSTEELTNTKLHQLVEDASMNVTAITSLTALTDPVADTDTLPIADDSATAIRKVAASNFLKKNASSVYDAGTTRVTGVATPTNASDATTKAYVDSIAVIAGNLPTVTSGNNGSLLRVTSGVWTTTASDAVSSAQIQDASVTGAKLENSGATAGTYGGATSIPQITVDAKGRITSALAFNATPADGTVSTAKIVDSAVTTAKIADSSITTAKIADESITTAKIAIGAVITADLADASVTATKTDTTSVAVLGTAQSFTTAHGFSGTTLTDAASISWNLASNQVATVTLAGNRTLANPTNKVNGNVYILVVKQDATGGRTLSFGTDYKFAGGSAPTITTTASKADVFTFVCDGTNMLGVASLSFL